MTALQWQIGSVRIARVVEVEAALPPAGLIPEATAEALAPHESWLRPHFLDDDGNIILSIHALVAESQGRRITG